VVLQIAKRVEWKIPFDFPKAIRKGRNSTKSIREEK